MLRNLKIVALTLFIGLIGLTSAAFADSSLQRYGVEIRGGFGMYEMGDITPGAEFIRREQSGSVLTTGDSGPVAGFSAIFRPTKHTLWEAGYNALMDVENLVEGRHPDTTGSILMHASEFFMKASGVILLTDRIHLDLGAGLAYYNVDLQIQDEFGGRFNYDAVARSWGLLGSGNLEFLFAERTGLVLGGGARVTNATDFSHEATTGVRSILPVLGGSRPFEVNLTGAYGQLGLRFYFDKVTKPVDFGR